MIKHSNFPKVFFDEPALCFDETDKPEGTYSFKFLNPLDFSKNKNYYPQLNHPMGFMKATLDQFFKNRISLALAILCLLALFFAKVVPEIYLSLDIANKKSLLVGGLLGFGITKFILFRSKTKKGNFRATKIAEIPLTQKSYQNLLDEMSHYQKNLKKNRMWIYGSLFICWLSLSLGTWVEQPPFNHPLFAISLFAIAMLNVARSLEEEYKLDVRTAKCIVEGIEHEKNRPELKSSYFNDSGKRFKGNGMQLFAFIRLSPFMMIVFFLFSAGPIGFFADYFSIPRLIAICGFSVFLGLVYAVLARLTCRPYFWMLGKMQSV